MLVEGRNAWCKGGGIALQEWALSEGEMNRAQSPRGGMTFERGRNTSCIEMRRKSKKVGSEQHLFRMDI